VFCVFVCVFLLFVEFCVFVCLCFFGFLLTCLCVLWFCCIFVAFCAVVFDVFFFKHVWV